MRIGVDAVNLACMVKGGHFKRILDVGTGCGVIALICAQRFEEAAIEAIDIDEASVQEASENFRLSPWNDRLKCEMAKFSEWASSKKSEPYDLIISNPPYFDAGIDSPDSARLIARHEGSLSPESLIRIGKNIIAPYGTIAMIFPSDRYDEIIGVALSEGMKIERAAYIRGHRKAEVKRIMVELKKAERNPGYVVVPEIVTLEEIPGEPTKEYKSLCRDFYLKF